MKKETTIDLTKIEEAKKAIEKAEMMIREARQSIASIQDQFCEMVLDEIEKNPVVECEYLRTEHYEYSIELYPSVITVCDVPVYLYVSVSPKKNNPDLSSDFILMGVKFDCSSFEVSDRFIEPRKNLTLHFADTNKNILLHCEKPVGT